jgi:hypothetical protein
VKRVLCFSVGFALVVACLAQASVGATSQKVVPRPNTDQNLAFSTSLVGPTSGKSGQVVAYRVTVTNHTSRTMVLNGIFSGDDGSVLSGLVLNHGGTFAGASIPVIGVGLAADMFWMVLLRPHQTKTVYLKVKLQYGEPFQVISTVDSDSLYDRQLYTSWNTYVTA